VQEVTTLPQHLPTHHKLRLHAFLLTCLSEHSAVNEGHLVHELKEEPFELSFHGSVGPLVPLLFLLLLLQFLLLLPVSLLQTLFCESAYFFLQI
jgi:hypothetical protein